MMTTLAIINTSRYHKYVPAWNKDAPYIPTFHLTFLYVCSICALSIKL